MFIKPESATDGVLKAVDGVVGLEALLAKLLPDVLVEVEQAQFHLALEDGLARLVQPLLEVAFYFFDDGALGRVLEQVPQVLAEAPVVGGGLVGQQRPRDRHFDLLRLQMSTDSMMQPRR